jgi:hypothetical protein
LTPAVVLAEFPAQVVARDEAAKARVERLDVVILQVDLDEGLPVVVAVVHFHVVQHVAREIQVARDGQGFQLVHHVVAVLLEQQAVPVFQPGLRQVQARGVREVRRANQLALQVVGPAVQRADNRVGIAAAIEHQRLAMAANIGQQFDAVRIANQHAAFIFGRQRGKVADIRHHQLMADVTRAFLEQFLHFTLQQRFVKIDGDRKLRVGTRQLGVATQIGHPNPP